MSRKYGYPWNCSNKLNADVTLFPLQSQDTIAETPWLAGRPCPIHQGILVLNRRLAGYTSQPPHQAHFEPG